MVQHDVLQQTSMTRTLLIGVDVGGTNTDSVLVDPHRVNEANKGVISWNKSVTTNDVSDGISNGVSKLMEDAVGIDKNDITSVTIGTTHFINAVIEQDASRLEKVAILRLCGPYSREIPPFSSFPNGLRSIMEGYVGYLNGGFHVDGKSIQPVDENEVMKHVDEIKGKNISSIVINGIFSSLNPEQEIQVKEMIHKVYPCAKVVMSHEVSGVGYIERENASILNASILSFSERIIGSIVDAIENRMGFHCPVFLTQNDGTVLSAHECLKFPIRTFSSGTTNSMRGASFLGNVIGKQAIVVDVGGTTADVGLLLPTGFPRESSSYCNIGSVRLNFGMPHVESIGLGGGSLVREVNGDILVGPESVGSQILTRALIFEGNEVTASDVAVAADSNLTIGDSSKVKNRFSEEFIAKFQERVKLMLEIVVDKMKTSPEDVTVIAVGGGSFIIPENLNGASKVIRPEFYGVANAIGAALGKISSEVHVIRQLNGEPKEEILEQLKQEAIEKAHEKGALVSSTKIAYISSEPIPYCDGAYEFMVKTISDIDYDVIKQKFSRSLNIRSEARSGIFKDSHVQEQAEVDLDAFDYLSYKPVINSERQWILSEIDLELLRIGTYILGCGGGGDPFPEFLSTRNLLRKGETICVVDTKDIAKYTKGTGSIGSLCSAGSPTVSNEQLKGPGMVKCVEVMKKFTGKSIDLVFPVEVGGGNGMSVFRVATSSQLNVPVIDCDLMGRAYPTHWQTIPVVNSEDGKPCYPPLVASNGNGNTIIVAETKSDYLLEKVLRASLSEIGCTVDLINPPMDEKTTTLNTIHGSLSLAWRIGRAVRIARQRSEIYKMPQRILEAFGNSGKLLFEGKIVGVERRLHKGHVWGDVLIESLDKTHVMTIPFKNENIYAKIDDKVVCSVPDLISIIDSNTGEAVGTPDYRYGLFVFVLGIAPSDKWTSTTKAIEIGGPKGFDLEDVDYKPISEYKPPLTVFDEFFSD